MRAMLNSRQGQIACYAAATLTQAGVGVVIIPLLARALERSTFGQWALLEPALLVAVQLGLFGADYGAVKLVGHDGRSPTQAFRLLTPAVLLTSAVAALLGAAACAWWNSIHLGAWVAFAVMCEALYLLGLATLRGANRAGSFAIAVGAKSGVLVCFGTSAAFFGRPELTTVANVVALYGIASCCGLGTVCFNLWPRHTHAPAGTPTVTPEVTPQTGRQAWRTCLQYGAPMLAAGLVGNVVTSGDRYVLGFNLGVQEVATYAVLVKLANLLNLVANPVNLWFPAARFRHAQDADRGQAFFSATADLAAFGYVGIGALMWLLIPYILPWFAPGFSWLATVGALLVATAVLRSLTPPLNVGLLAVGKTHWNFVIAATAAALQLTLLFLLVPHWGLVGAALSTLLTQAAATAMEHLGSQRTHPLHWPYPRMFGFALGGALLAWLCSEASRRLGLHPLSSASCLALTWALAGALLFRHPLRLAARGTSTAPSTAPVSPHP